MHCPERTPSYQGHLPDGSGIQRHSAGATCPFIVMLVGDAPGVLHPDGRFERVASYTVRDRADRIACLGYAIQRAADLAAASRPFPLA